jgi:hypothetical protein
VQNHWQSTDIEHPWQCGQFAILSGLNTGNRFRYRKSHTWRAARNLITGNRGSLAKVFPRADIPGRQARGTAVAVAD